MFKSKDYGFGLLFFKRISRLFKWLFPSIQCVPALLIVLLICLGLLEQYIRYQMGLIPSKYYRVLGNKDREGFWRESIIAAALIVSNAIIRSTITFVSALLYLQWRQNITTGLHSMYFTETVYYAVNEMEKSIDNVDQRIVHDVEAFCDKLSKIMVPVLLSPFTIGYYLYKSFQGSGAVGPVGVLIFFLLATAINKILMSRVVKFVFLREKMEGNFRYKHMQIRSNCESAALLRSGHVEEEKCNNHLKNLLDVQHGLIWKEYGLNFSIQTFEYLGSIFSYVAISAPIFLGAYDNLIASDLFALISANAFVVSYLIKCCTQLFLISNKVTNVAGNTHRIGELMEALEILMSNGRENGSSNKAGNKDVTWSESETLLNNAGPPDEYPYTCEESKGIVVSDLTYCAPNSSQQLVQDLCFKFELNRNILVTGGSGCGKSSLLRVVNGLWSKGRGSIKTVPLKPSVIMFLPQKTYLTDGSLRQQIIHPKSESEIYNGIGVDDDDILRYLEKVDLTHICTRTGGLDVQVDWNWYDELTPGEVQRLSFVRLFHHKPKFAVLDESTSQIGLEAEQTMYSICKDLGITYMSVGHRDSLKQYHDVELHLEGNGGWTLSPILSS